MWRLFGEGPLEKTKQKQENKKKETKPIGDLAIPMVLFFVFFLFCFCCFFFVFLVFCFGVGGWAYFIYVYTHIYIYTYIYIYTTHGWFEMPISFFWEWQAVGARCFISFDHHTQKREGGVVSAFFLHFWHFISAKDTKPCSFQNQTLLLLQQKKPLCILNSSPNVLHRYIASAKTSMNNK